MARTTGYTASAVVDILDQKIFNKKGVFAPEQIGSSVNVINYLLNHLNANNIQLKKIN